MGKSLRPVAITRTPPALASSGMISGVGFGYVADHYGWGSTYIVILAFAVVGMLTIATIWNAKGDGYEAAAKFNAEREKKINLQA